MNEPDQLKPTFENQQPEPDEVLSLGQKATGPSVGERIRQAREAAGLSPADLAQPLNLDLKVIERVECDQLDAVPGRPYILAYLRSWAELLGLDAETLIAQYNTQQAPKSGGAQGGVHPTLDVMDSRGGGLGSRLIGWVVILLLIVLVGIGLAQLDSERIQAWWSAQHGDSAEGESLTLGAASPDSAAAEWNIEPPPAPSAEPASEPIAATTRLPEQRLMAIDQAEGVDADEIDTAPAEDSASPDPAANVPVLLLRATQADSWIEVRDGKGERLMYDVLVAGEERSFFEVEGPFSLVLGHPDGMEVEYKGESVVLDAPGDATGVLRTTVGSS
ncbi:MAG TPA: RodZ domain-containing protein [Guyparkeria sp.]|nr:RodZ domain-containing protein [Guyparkeria sp.]